MRSFILAVALILISAVSFGGEITKTYQFSNYTIESLGEYQIIKFDDCLNTGYTGEPSLPWYAVKLLLPPGEKAVSFTIIPQDEEQINGRFLLYPQQASRPISHGNSGIFQINDELYGSYNVYPLEANGILNTSYMNGHSIAMLNICPVSYIPADGHLSFFKEITVTIKTEKLRDSEEALLLLSSTEKVHKSISSFVQNPELLSDYPQKENRSDDYQLLIITPQSFENDFDNLIELYMYRGLKSEIMTTEEIASTMTGQDLQEQIRNYIIQEYTAHNVEFVLLGGDVEHVPYRGFYCYVESGSGYSDNDIPADLYYSALDGTWNDNGDNLWGEIGEDDLLPEVAVGRFSFSNTTELSAMLHKTSAYQDDPILGEFTNPLLAGEHLWDDPITWGSDYMRLLIGFQDENGYTTVGIPPDQTIDSLYERWQNWGGSTIIAEINDGKSFVHHCGHANSSTVMHLGISDITNSNFSQVNGITHNYTFVQSHGCICGAFDNSDCIMEHMVKIENFAAAVIGNSRYGWFNEGQTEGPSTHLHREMLDALYEEQIGRIGAAFMESKIQTAPWVNAPGQHEEGALRWNFYDINILGDPTLQIWTDEPFTVNAIFTAPILIGTTSMDVTVMSGGAPLEGLACTLTKDGVFHGTAVSDANGDATIMIDPIINSIGTAKLTISGYNCLTTTYNVAVSPAGGPFMIYHDHEIDDNTGGNGNGLVDPEESILMTIEIANAGTLDGTDVTAVLSSTDEYITITDSEGIYGFIAAGTAAGTINDFAFDAADYYPDQHIVEFSLSISGNGKEQWFDGFNLTLNAPILEIGDMNINDDIGGNGDGFLDPGETATISFNILNNGHSDAYETMVSCSTISEYVSPSYDITNIGNLTPGLNQTAEFQISVDEDAPLGTSVSFDIHAESGSYDKNKTFGATIGILVEDWETGDFSKFNWQFAADAPWEMCTTEPYEGLYCAKSGDVDDSQDSELFVTLEVLAAGDMYFYRKVSSEPEWDYLKFYIDYTLMGEWSGELDWEMVSFPVSLGLHTFRWVYEKDPYYSNGEDCAWVDYIVFPPVDIHTGIIEGMQEQQTKLKLMPNPARSTLFIQYEIANNSAVAINLFDVLGNRIMDIENSSNQPAGKYNLQIDIADIKPGIYLCRIISSKGMITKKLIIE